MKAYKITIVDRNYSKYTIYEISNFQIINIVIDPYKNKLFNNDIITIDDDDNINIIHSMTKSSLYISGVLFIDKKYYIMKNGINLIYYKCTPDDLRLPIFYVPYDIDNNKCDIVNLYITFTFIEWTDNPYGIIEQVIGPVDVLNNFYEYKLYCKTLNSSLHQFQLDVNNAIEKNENFIDAIMKKYPNIENRTDHNIFTIDSTKSLDYDDAIGIKNIDDGVSRLSIYIANVSIVMDILNLWNSFSKRISNIYLPDKKRPMLPSILTDCLCSLQENKDRIAFTMDIFIKDNDIVDIIYSNSLIKISKNYEYEEESLLNNSDYIRILEIVKNLSKKYRYITNIITSHKVISYLMVFMNYHCATEMIKYKNGIFRSTIMNRNIIVPTNLPDDVSKFIKIWYNSCGHYMNGNELLDEDKNVKHQLLDLDSYIHISSPNRRLVDLLNIIKFQENSKIIMLSENSKNFYDKWLEKLDYINMTTRSIRKIQINCSLLDLCSNNPDILNKQYDGYLFDKISRNDNLFQYMVYLPELKLSSKINLKNDIENFEMRKFQLFLYNNSENFKKKIRLYLYS